MGTLNPNLLSKHASLILNESAKIMTTVGKRLLRNFLKITHQPIPV